MLAVISIILAIVIYKLSNDTSAKLAEEAAQHAFEKLYGGSEPPDNQLPTTTSKVVFDKGQIKIGRKLLLQLLKRAKKNSSTAPWVHAALFPIQLKDVTSEDTTVALMYKWKAQKIISWDGPLDSSTKVIILKGDALIESFSTC